MKITVKMNGHEVEYFTTQSGGGDDNGEEGDIEPYYDVVKITSEFKGHETVARDISIDEVSNLFEKIKKSADK